MSESDTREDNSQGETSKLETISESPNTTEAIVETPKTEVPDTSKIKQKPPKTLQKIKDEIKNVEKNTVTYINEWGQEFEAKITETLTAESGVNKQPDDVKDQDKVHHLEYIENGIKKIVRSVHHIDVRPPMADGKRVCVWK